MNIYIFILYLYEYFIYIYVYVVRWGGCVYVVRWCVCDVMLLSPQINNGTVCSDYQERNGIKSASERRKEDKKKNITLFIRC